MSKTGLGSIKSWDALKEVLMVKRANFWWWQVLNSVEALQEVLMVKRADWRWWEGEQD